MPQAENEKYAKFLSVIRDVADFQHADAEVDISLEKFTAAGLSVSDVRDFMKKATDEKVIAKKNIWKAAKEVSSSLKFDFRRQSGSAREGDVAYYHLELFMSKSEIANHILSYDVHESASVIPVYWNDAAEIWVELKAAHCWQMGVDSKQFKVLSILIAATTALRAGEIVERLEADHDVPLTTGAVRQQKEQINANFKRIVLNAREPLIVSGTGYGYCINPLYKITKQE